MSLTQINYDINADGIASITLIRPEVGNAFNDILIAELLATLKDVEENPAALVLILRSAGKHFSAGADLRWMKAMAEYDHAHNVADAMVLSQLMDTLYRLKKPTLACVQGAAFGGAVGLVACCDIAIAETNALFCLSEVKLGLSPAVISPYVIRAIGARQASRFFLTAEKFSSQKAEQLGLVHDIVPLDALQDAVQALALSISKNSPTALSATKTLIQRVTEDKPNPELRQYTGDLIASLRVSEDGQEGISAFFEKRNPQWIQPKRLNPN